jgi:hypothetical protein
MKRHNLDLGRIKYSEKELEKNIKLFDSIDWYNISKNQKLSEEFIDKYSKIVSWRDISCCQYLSEEFMEKHQNKISWCYISCCQKLSEKFITKHIDKIDFEGLMENKYISHKIKEEIKILKEII